MTTLLYYADLIGLLLTLVSISHATQTPYCSAGFGSPRANDCYDLVYKQGAIPQDSTPHAFLYRGHRRPPGVPAWVWKSKVYLPIIRQNKECILAVLPIRDTDGFAAATIDSWCQIAEAAASTSFSSVRRECVLPPSIMTGGYISTGYDSKLVVVLYQPDSVFDKAVENNVSAGLVLVAERNYFEKAYEHESIYLQIVGEPDLSAAAPAKATE